MTGACLTALLVSLSLQPCVIAALRRGQLLDLPGHRSNHSAPTPRGGGVAVVAAFVVAVSVFGGGPFQWHLLGGVMALALLGGADDLYTLPPKTRLACQVLVALLLSATFTSHLSGLGLRVVGGALFVAWLLVYVNAFNFMDGVNGISSLHGIIAGVYFLVLSVRADEPELASYAAALIGACAGFAPYNAIRARVFLGDVGSYGLGAVIALLAAALVARDVPAPLVAAPLLVYVWDVTYTLLRRLSSGENVLQAHSEHIYQRLQRSVRNHVVTSGLVSLGSVTVVAVVEAAHRTASAGGDVWAGLGVLAVLGGYTSLPRASARSSRGGSSASRAPRS